jgi:hypothetical protein
VRSTVHITDVISTPTADDVLQEYVVRAMIAAGKLDARPQKIAYVSIDVEDDARWGGGENIALTLAWTGESYRERRQVIEASLTFEAMLREVAALALELANTP